MIELLRARLRTLLVCLAVAHGIPAALAAQPHSEPPLVLRGVTLIDGTGSPPMPNTTVVVRDGRIAARGADGSIELPPTARVLDIAAGKFVIPGLWDMHVHAMREGRSEWHFPLYLANGVTGIREMGTFLDSLDTWRGRLARGEILGPRVVAAGHIVDGPAPSADPPPPDRPTPAWFFALHVEHPDEAAAIVDTLIRRGVDFVKVYSGLSREAYLAVAEAATARGIPFAGHVPNSVTTSEAADAGQRSIEHLTNLLEECTPGLDELRERYQALSRSGLPSDSILATGRSLAREGLDSYNAQGCAPVFERFVAQGTRHVPTLVILRGLAHVDDPTFASDPRRRYVPDKILARWEPRPGEDAEVTRMLYRKHLELVGDLHRAGVVILAGTDASDEVNVFPGSSLHDELGLLVEAGLSPIEAIQSATREPAQFLGHADSLGTIEVGKLADLLILEANPLDDIANTRRIAAMVYDGRLFTRDDLDDLLEQAEAAARNP